MKCEILKPRNKHLVVETVSSNLDNRMRFDLVPSALSASQRDWVNTETFGCSRGHCEEYWKEILNK